MVQGPHSGTDRDFNHTKMDDTLEPTTKELLQQILQSLQENELICQRVEDAYNRANEA